MTVHVPLTRSTRGLIGREAIAKLKPGSIVLNVARGGVIDEAAVAEALRSGHLGGAGIDVFEHEPPTDSPLLDAPNTLLTPHLGASTAEAQILVAEEVAAQVLDVLDGRSARYAVNAPLLTPETARAIAPYLPLAEVLGRFFAQFSRGGVRTLTLEIAGELAEHDGTPLTAAVLRGLLETATTERVNLVNAGALAKARGITVVERKTPDAGAFAALLTLSGETGGRTTVVAGTVAAGEPRITRLDDYRLDMAPADVDAHHPPHGSARDGRAGRDHARRGRRQHQRDAPRQEPSARGRPDDPGPRRRRPRVGVRGDPRPGGRPRPVDDPPGRRPLSGSAAGLIPDGLDATLVLVRHGESVLIAEDRFQGQMETPAVADRAGSQARAGRAAAGAIRTTRRRCRCPPASCVEIVHSPLRPDGRRRPTAIADARSRPAGRAPAPCGRTPASSRSARAPGRASRRPRSASATADALAGLAPPAARGLGARRRIAGRGGRARATGAPARCSSDLADGPASRARSIASRSPASATRRRTHPWSIVVGHDGVFKIALLTLFDLPLERFWMWSMDLCGITVVELRAGRPVLRAHNLTAHLAGLPRRRRPGRARGRRSRDRRRS